MADLPGRSTPPVKHRSLEHHYTKYVDMYYITLADLLADLTPQWSMDPMNTSTPNTFICTTSYWQIYPPIEHRSHEHQCTKYIHMYYLILADLLADLPPNSAMHYGMYIMDVFGSHFGFSKKRWEFAFIFE